MTKAQQVYERVEALVAGGARKSEAYAQVADELGLKVSSVRGAYYQHHRKANGPAAKRRETTAADAVSSAKAALERAVTAIDVEIAAAKERADEATAEYEALKTSAEERQTAITAKIALLDS